MKLEVMRNYHYLKLQTQSSDLGRQRGLSEYHTKLEGFPEQEESYSAYHTISKNLAFKMYVFLLQGSLPWESTCCHSDSSFQGAPHCYLC